MIHTRPDEMVSGRRCCGARRRYQLSRMSCEPASGTRVAPIRQSRPEYGTEKAVTASIWHREGSQGQNMAHMRQSRPAYGTHKAVSAKFGPWLSDESP